MFIPRVLCTQFGEIKIEISFKTSIFTIIETYHSNYSVNKISKCFVSHTSYIHKRFIQVFEHFRKVYSRVQLFEYLCRFLE